MTEQIIKIVGVTVVCTVVTVIVSRYIPEYVPLVQIAGIIGIFLSFFPVIKEIGDYCEYNFTGGFFSDGYFLVLFKALGIATVSKFGSEICKDSGSSALAFALELTAKAAIISLCLPMLKNLAEITSGLLKG